MIRKLLNVLVIAAGVGAFPGMMLEIVAKTRITPATTVMMMPRITKTMEIITFRECAAPKAFRPRMTKMAPTKIQDEADDSNVRKPTDEGADEDEQDARLRPVDLPPALRVPCGREPRHRPWIHRCRSGRCPRPCPGGQGTPAVHTEQRSRSIRRATTRTGHATRQSLPPPPRDMGVH